MKPLFNTFKRNHATIESLSTTELHAELGDESGKAAAHGPATPDTSALRMSLALIKSGLSFTGRVALSSGPNAGRSVEINARRLARQITRPALFGQPQSIAPGDARSQLAGKRGVVFFSKPQAQGGHIDIVEPANLARICNAASHFPVREIRFWPLA